MAKNKYPEVRKVSVEEYSMALEMVKDVIPKEVYEIFEGALNTLGLITEKLEDDKVKLKQLLKQLFGTKSEKSSKVLSSRQDWQKEEQEVKAKNITEASPKKNKPSKSGEKRKGHGQNGVEKYTGAQQVEIKHENLESGCTCPECGRGKIYDTKKPGILIHIEGKAPIEATVYKTEKLRCNLCGEIFEADRPLETSATKHYDETAKAMMAILRYGHGMPLNRLENLQAQMGIPLPASTTWEKTKEAAQNILPIYKELMRLAAQGKLLHNDDTGMKILTIAAEIEKEIQKADGKKIRTGIFTTGIVSEVEQYKIALFFTGRKHAGENLDDLLKQRESDRSPPIQMSDGKIGNTIDPDSTIAAHCNTHARRHFVNVSDNFPDETAYVLLDVYKEIYKNDAHARDKNMSPEQRLLYHQKKSKPIMDSFHLWMRRQFDQKLVEENSSLGQAIAYTLKRWEQLTLFLRIPAVPLDNNICERALKKAICHRKNSLFYKTANGARIGDMFMSLMHTCAYARINPFDYFTQLLRHASSIAENPSKWLPWNYQLQLQS